MSHIPGVDTGRARVHLIGVGGIAMGTLAALLRRRGHHVQGSDQHIYPPMSEFLASEGIPLLDGYRVEHITEDLNLVVVGNAVSRGNVELEHVLERRIRYLSLPEALRELFLWDARPVVIAGTHGKTTTTALAGWLLAHGGIDPSVFVGGIAKNLGEGGSSYRLGRADAPFVIEGDEYDSAFFDKTAKFLKYVPEIVVVNNVEYDHADIYPDLDAVRLAFRRLVALVPRSGLTLLGLDSVEAAALASLAQSRVETFGTAEGATWQATQLQAVTGGTSFHLRHDGRECGRVHLPLSGAHNVRNALAALAIGHAFDVPLETMRDGLALFQGVKRRLEVIGVGRGVTVYDDFAHHPTAVAESLAAVRGAAPGRRIWAVFEPRSASSCRKVFQQAFAVALGAADQVLLASVFRSTLADEERLSEDLLVQDLRGRGVAARHLTDVDAIVRVVAAEADDGDLVVIMSNGGFGGIHQKLLAALS
ncbi:MAG: UDP-N-acetylmuramate:L-alanyl-gamma-D-glutamyl-meso-diaminopimelate ligase [Acidobacteriota bacterium]